MKNILRYTFLVITLFGQSTAFAKDTYNTYEVTVTNLTRGQVMSPVVAATHNKQYQLFVSGAPASIGLAALAQDADSSILVPDLLASPYVFDVVDPVSTGAAPFPPGASQTIIIKSRGNKRRISLVSMLVTTNDAFAALNGIRLPNGNSTRTYTIPAYDAGSEENNESCKYIPGPPCNNPLSAPDEVDGEGFVHIHAGIHNVGDLVAAEHDWRNPVAKVSIKRIKNTD